VSFFVDSLMVRCTSAEIWLFVVVIMESFTVRRIWAKTLVFMAFIMESCTSGVTTYPMT
jgi:hypothetical protein